MTTPFDPDLMYTWDSEIFQRLPSVLNCQIIIALLAMICQPHRASSTGISAMLIMMLSGMPRADSHWKRRVWITDRQVSGSSGMNGTLILACYYARTPPDSVIIKTNPPLQSTILQTAATYDAHTSHTHQKSI